MSLSRREFIGIGGAAVAGVALAPGLRLIDLARARSPDEAASQLQRWGLLVDITKCRDCDVCVTACRTENWPATLIPKRCGPSPGRTRRCREEWDR